MRIYFDMCCLKRPFDNQSQPRVRLESEAILALLSAADNGLEFVCTGAHVVENDRNPVVARAARVREWIRDQSMQQLTEDELATRVGGLIKMGLRSFDALHLASAELSFADVFCTCDDRLAAFAARNASRLKVRVLGPLELAQEILR